MSPALRVLPCPSALLFDLDGTLVDSRRDIAEALNSALSALGRQPLALAEIVPMIGDGARMLVARALGAEASDERLLDRAAALFLACYTAHPCVHTILLPGAREAIALDIPRAVITNKPRGLALRVLEELGIARAFGFVYAGGDGPLKPAPDGVHATVERLGVAADAAWLIGDGPQDVLAGRAAGCFTIAVPGIAEREGVLAAKPDLVVTSLHDVVTLAFKQLTSASDRSP